MGVVTRHFYISSGLARSASPPPAYATQPGNYGQAGAARGALNVDPRWLSWIAELTAGLEREEAYARYAR